MKIGFIGLGKMGSQMVKKILAGGNQVVVYDVNDSAIQELVDGGAIGAKSRDELIALLGEKPTVWLMIPSDFVEPEINALSKLLPSGSLVVDGGNSDFRLTQKRAAVLEGEGIRFLDVGTSGGILGLEHGFSMMIGGTTEDYERIRPVLDALAMPHGGHSRMGAVSSGHYVKMIHNGIEYGMMQSLAEGYQLLREGPIQNIDLRKVSIVWQKGSVIESTLNKLAGEVFEADSSLDDIDGYVAESGEGKWTLEVAKDANVDMPALEQAIRVRRDSQQGATNYATKILAALRNKFGGHSMERPNRG